MLTLRIAQRHVLAIEIDNQIWIGGAFHTATLLPGQSGCSVIARLPGELTPPRQGAFVELIPALGFDQAAQSRIDAGLRQAAGDFKERAQHHHVGGARIAEFVGSAGEIESEHMDVVALDSLPESSSPL